MRRREDRAITKHTLNLYVGDYDKLRALYSTRIGAAKIIRDLVHWHLRKIEADAAQKIPLVDDLDVEIEDRDLMESLNERDI
jgi:hypothetical protein